jgi:hypothetical protein
MPPAQLHFSITTCAADALFASTLQCSEAPSAGQIRQAIDAAIAEFGFLGCTGRVAQEFGDHPEMAAARMRWARAAVRSTFGDLVPAPRRSPDLILSAA